jgi:hypothetical protein
MRQGDVAEPAAWTPTAGAARPPQATGGRDLGIDGVLLAAHRADARGGRRVDDAGERAGLGSLMRHILAPRPIPGLTGGVVEPAAPALLIASAGRQDRRLPSARRAGRRAVPIPAVAMPAEEEQAPTVRAGAEHEAERVEHASRARREGMDTREELCEV